MECKRQHQEGIKKAAWREWVPRRPRSADPPGPALQEPMAVRRLVDGSIVLRGAVSGITYLFGGRGSVLSVDGRDVASLLATGQFVAARPES